MTGESSESVVWEMRHFHLVRLNEMIDDVSDSAAENHLRDAKLHLRAAEESLKENQLAE